MSHRDPPSPANAYHAAHVAVLVRSLAALTGRALTPRDLSPAQQAEWLYYADFAVLSHDTAPDPVFNYANQTALRLFELDWPSLITLPSRHSAAPIEQTARQRLLDEVTRQGYIENYCGVRIARSGRRFYIENTLVWNLYDEQDHYYGQAAWIANWRDVS